MKVKYERRPSNRGFRAEIQFGKDIVLVQDDNDGFGMYWFMLYGEEPACLENRIGAARSEFLKNIIKQHENENSNN